MPTTRERPRPSDDRGREPEPRRDEAARTAAYVASLSGELSVLARGHGLELVAYFLDLARIEAMDVAVPRAPRRTQPTRATRPPG